MNEFTKDLSQASLRRGFKPSFLCGPNNLEYLLLFPDETQGELFRRMHFRGQHQEAGPNNQQRKEALSKRRISRVFQEAARTGVEVFDGTTLKDDFFEAHASTLGISVDEFIRIFGLSDYKGLSVARRDAEPATRLHEYVHIRDYSLEPFQYLYYRPAEVAYEILTNIRAAAIAPGLRSSLHPGFGAYLKPHDPRVDANLALSALSNRQADLNKLSDVVYQLSDCPTPLEARRAFNAALDYVVHCEAQNPPIAEEVRPEFLNMWT